VLPAPVVSVWLLTPGEVAVLELGVAVEVLPVLLWLEAFGSTFDPFAPLPVFCTSAELPEGVPCCVDVGEVEV
jgi:hypothetical protein